MLCSMSVRLRYEHTIAPHTKRKKTQPMPCHRCQEMKLAWLLLPVVARVFFQIRLCYHSKFSSLPWLSLDLRLPMPDSCIIRYIHQRVRQGMLRGYRYSAEPRVCTAGVTQVFFRIVGAGYGR